MKNRISTIMDTTKKRTGITILSGVLIVTMGTGMVFAASSSYPNITAVTQGSAFEASDVAETQVQSSAPMAESYTYKTDGNGASEASVRLYESEADIFTVYEKFGLIYNKENNRLYYNNKLVRYFEDNRKTDGTFYGTVSQNVDGDVDVHSVRNSAGDLTGVEPYTQAEFDAGITHKKTA